MLELPQMNEDDTDYSKYNQRELNSIFLAYCAFGNFEKIKLMLTSPNMLIKPNINVESDRGFRWLMEKSRIEIIDYLIFAQNMKKTSSIENYFKYSKNKNVDIVRNKFILRDVNESLNVDLASNDINVKKPKL